MKPHPVGKDAERAAAELLRRHGLRIVASNFHCRWGEIDLIAEHRDELVFVEVRQRRNHDYGGAEASVNAGKQRRLARAALAYLQKTAQTQRPCRFDVVAFGTDGAPANWIRNAFEAEGIGYLAPIASNQTDGGRTQNRRVEAILVSTE